MQVDSKNIHQMQVDSKKIPTGPWNIPQVPQITHMKGATWVCKEVPGVCWSFLDTYLYKSYIECLRCE